MTNTNEIVSLGACAHTPLFTCLPAGTDASLLPSGSVLPSRGVFEAGGAEAVVRFSSAENPFLSPLDLLEEDQNSCDADSGGSASGSSILGDSDWGSSVTGDSSGASDAFSWWLLHTKPRQEKKLSEQLTRLEISHYLPATKCRAITRGRTRITWSPLFSGYFFLLGTPAQRLRALETNRIVATHRVDDSEGLRARLWELADLIEKGAPLTAEARLAKGRKVRVKSGPFQNMEGTVIKRGGQTRIFVMVSQLLGGVSMEIEEHLLEPVF